MATQFQLARHVAARNAILIWLSGVIMFAGIGILLTYHSLRDHSMQAVNAAPAKSTSSLANRQAGDGAVAGYKARTDSAADIARAHNSAVEAAAGPDITYMPAPGKD